VVAQADYRTSGLASQCSGIFKIETKEECEAVAKANNKYYKGRTGHKDPHIPFGCFHSTYDSKYWFNDNPNSTSSKCNSGRKCICKGKKTCNACPINTYSKGGINVKCEPCKNHMVTIGTGQSNCTGQFNEEYVMWKLDNIDNIIAKQKEKQNDLSIKNSRLWQKEQIRLEHDKLMQERKQTDDDNEAKLCKEERDTHDTIIVPAIEINQEIEKIEDTTCIDTNRDELLKSFCSLTSDLDKLFKIQGIDKEAKSFWPNICCKERRDTTLEVCEDPEGNIQRENIIPFALSQGGHYSRHNLYAEVSDVLKRGGYLHRGMHNLLMSLEDIKSHNDEMIMKNKTDLINTFFNEMSLCGPRILNDPKNSEKKLCELFIPYQHTMKRFYDLIKHSYTSELKVQKATFLEMMETSFKKRQNRLGKNRYSGGLSAVMQSKPKQSSNEEKTCSHSSKWTQKELKEKKKTFCLGYKHVDLSNSNVKTIAIHFVEKDIVNKCTEDKECMNSLQDLLRYDVIDNSCPAPLFTAKDISLQQIDMDTFGDKAGAKKAWVATVQLNTQSANGFLQSELPYCEDKNYLIGTKVTVKAYVDVKDCCGKIVDSAKCKKEKPQCKLKELKNIHDEHYVKDVDVTGTDYKVEFKNDFKRQKRRRLLDRHQGGC
jgi:hypothetical protein